jgi:hypothetical protein
MPPSFSRLRASRPFPHPAQDGALRNIEAKHGQLAVDARGTPGWVLGNHAEDELAQLYADMLSPRRRPMLRRPGPIRFESGAVPAHNRLWLDKDQCLFPSRPEPFQYHPEQSVENSKSWLRMCPPQDRELLPKRQVFQKQIASGAKELGCQNRQRPQWVEHETLFSQRRARSIRFVAIAGRYFGVAQLSA